MNIFQSTLKKLLLKALENVKTIFWIMLKVNTTEISISWMINLKPNLQNALVLVQMFALLLMIWYT